MATKTAKFKKVSCSAKKTTAKAAADALRNKGKTARVRKNGNVYCVYEGPKSKVKRGGAAVGARKRKTAKRRRAA